MKRLIFVLAVGAIIIAGFTSSFGQTVSDEAKRHFNRGVAAVEMAKSPADYEAAIKEFKQAIDLAPDWADAYYNLGKVQEQAEKFADAVVSFKQYLRLSPKASDTDTVKSLIDKLEYKAENTLTTAGDVRKNSIGMEMVWIPAGTFRMGSENGDAFEKPVHRVTISQGFYMGKYEVTQGQWQAVMGTNPSYFKDCGSNCPVEQVSWEDAQEFIRKLNARNDGYTYRLPTEAEWEYAARAGTTGDYYGNLDSIAWYDGNSGNTTHPVRQKQANAFGLYDMSGNVWEWVQDWYDDKYYSRSPATDPAGAGSGQGRVVRGGSWRSYASYTRSANRYGDTPPLRSYGSGFRVAAARRQ
jgi:formylglycine-generating enzyme required for sulfatase activity